MKQNTCVENTHKLSSLIQTVTVGAGISPAPVHHAPARLSARGLYRRLGISPCPEDIFYFLFIICPRHNFVKWNSIFMNGGPCIDFMQKINFTGIIGKGRGLAETVRQYSQGAMRFCLRARRVRFAARSLKYARYVFNGAPRGRQRARKAKSYGMQRREVFRFCKAAGRGNTAGIF